MMLSIVIPVYNEAESLRELYAELCAVAQANNYALDVIFVDDGSTDAGWKVIAALAAADGRVRGLRFRRNFGKAAALNAGIAAARGELLMTLDADLQDDPHEIPRFLAEMAKNLDVVSGYKQVRHDPWHKVFPSRVFNAMVSWLTGVSLHDHNCGMKCCRRAIFAEVQLYGELHRFVPALAAARGYRAGELVIHHRPRRFGNSKYGVARFVKGFLDLLTVKFLTRYGQRPQHLLGSIGLGCVALGLAGCFLSLCGLTGGLISVGLLVTGGQLLTLGLVSELLVAQQTSAERGYSIAERTPEQSSLPPRLPEEPSSAP